MSCSPSIQAVRHAIYILSNSYNHNLGFVSVYTHLFLRYKNHQSSFRTKVITPTKYTPGSKSLCKVISKIKNRLLFRQNIVY